MTFSLHHIRRPEKVISKHPDTHNYSNTTTTANIITIIIIIIIMITTINIIVILYPTRLIKRKTTTPTATPYQPRKEIWKKGYEVIPTSTTLDSCMEREAGRLGETAMKSSPRPALSAPVWRERWDDWVRLEAHQPDSGPMVSTLYPVWYNGGSEEPMDGRMGAKVLDSMPASPLIDRERKSGWRDPRMKILPEDPTRHRRGGQDTCPNHPDLHSLPAWRNVWEER